MHTMPVIFDGDPAPQLRVLRGKQGAFMLVRATERGEQRERLPRGWTLETDGRTLYIQSSSEWRR